eukprot:GILK01002247.1.p1 GENE.GILK01002247.1~~GILK01002247.1.p1  ORF type:complete len:687 (+),score=85.68 GILK01002247.1:66-2126(+)
MALCLITHPSAVAPLWLLLMLLTAGVNSQATNIQLDEGYITSEFGQLEEVARSTARILEILDDRVTPVDLQNIVSNNVFENALVYGSAIAFEPDSYDFSVHNISTGVKIEGVNTTLVPFNVSITDRNGVTSMRSIYCPYASRGAGWQEGDPIRTIELAYGYDYTTNTTDWYDVPKQMFLADTTGKKRIGYWTAPYFDAGAGNINMVTFSVAFTTTKDLSYLTPANNASKYFWGIATIDVGLPNLKLWEPYPLQGYLIPVAATFAGITGILLLFTWAVILKHRNTFMMRATSPVFNYVILLGCVIGCVAAVIFVLQPSANNGLCDVRIWLTGTAVITVLGPLFAKTYRIAKLFHNPKLRAVRLTDKEMLMKAGALILIQMVIMVAWSASSERSVFIKVRNEGLSSQSYFEVPSCTTSGLFLGIDFVFLGALIAWGSWLVYRAKSAPSAFNESFHITVCLLFLMFYGIILIPLQFIISANPDAVAIIRAVGMLFGIWVVLGSLFVPKLLIIKHGQANNQAAGGKGNTTGSTHQVISQRYTEMDALSAGGSPIGSQIHLNPSAPRAAPNHKSSSSLLKNNRSTDRPPSRSSFSEIPESSLLDLNAAPPTNEVMDGPKPKYSKNQVVPELSLHTPKSDTPAVPAPIHGLDSSPQAGNLSRRINNESLEAIQSGSSLGSARGLLNRDHGAT